ncbi:MAG: hypothetical protein M3063_00720 [Actinomycetota bacterium]|nr:hypothetical protein [Actinomycetota bacterium]
MSTVPPFCPNPDLDGLAQGLADVDVALRRLDDGTYGTCEACGTDLAADILEVSPASRRCPEHEGPVARNPGATW